MLVMVAAQETEADLHDRDQLLGVVLGQLAGPLGQGDVGLLQDDVGVPAPDPLDGGEGEHDAGLALDVGVEDTQDVLEVGRHHQRHGGGSLLSETARHVS